MKKNNIGIYKKVMIYLIFFLSSCQDYLGDFPEYKKMPVINSSFCVDSCYKVSLTWTSEPKNNKYEVIKDATVVIKDSENEHKLVFDHMHECYKSKNKILSGVDYDLNVDILGFNHIDAHTYVPDPCKINIEYNKIASYDEFSMELTKIDAKVNAIYFYLFEYIDYREYNINRVGYEECVLYANSAHVDPFNRFRDDFGPQGYIYSYDAFVRIPAEAAFNASMQVDMATINPSRIVIIEATEEWDYYYKAAFIQRYFDPEINLPFTYEAVYLPSNINNAHGVFAGVSVQIFDFKNGILQKLGND